MSRDAAFDYLSNGPMCLVALDSSTGKPVQVNETFENYMGPLFKFQGYRFVSAATEGPDQEKLANAIEMVVEGRSNKATVRNVEMVTLSGDAGMPIRRFFDWTIGKGTDHCVLLFGEQVNEQDTEQREKDLELVDFFQNAPIALHWLSGDGIVIWANQTELDVLGYTAEEYIGQPIMKFCPDEEQLVLEIFKQLGSGNTIRDVPVRFRTKDGRIVDLLIDSNVKYDKEGKFSHTRCFIRDDTGRKVRDARAKLLLEETKRSLKMLDNFMSRSLHHMRTPLHVLQNTCDVVLTNVQLRVAQGLATPDDLDSLVLLQDATDHIAEAVQMVQDITDLSIFDQGREYDVKPEQVDLVSFGKSCLTSLKHVPSTVHISLEFSGGGPATIISEGSILHRILRRLLENAIVSTEEGSVTLIIGYSAGRCTFSVVDTGPGVSPDETEHREGTLPLIFQRYHQQFIPEETTDFDKASDLRKKIEDGISSHRKNGLGIGLSLSYHLVLSLGGDLRYSSAPGMTKFWFSLPASPSGGSLVSDLPCAKYTREILVLDEGMSSINLAEDTVAAKRKFQPMEEEKSMDEEPEIVVQKQKIASQGLKAMETPGVLVVEDTDACAKLLMMMLTKMNCSPTRASNGQEAVDIIRNSNASMFNLILMDLRMPVMDGLEATRIIKHELMSKIPVIALTGDGGEEIRGIVDEIGFEEFHNKPMKRAALKEVVEKYTLLS
mmetsp:Transcript_15524/g.22124  ORF Transcript_15524/g.22124 Transcript_15524/m.22124 type:complete len:719 (-) Transcript_15524:1218-3374(-)|eukprot:CAMPEP_0172414194 /NCGR_PEP_ID=MMETSP1064-20121228/882_1 /TAXON_ID=202472 /ORGANISM="Aulacoseira subarctica , Strain CCAP 1002/5" /LENGTH=718 /DNA_ID=CAMNT_0013150745 /DNA_START=145 /DNA_END=2301 /DNA_ORIENTATION=-